MPIYTSKINDLGEWVVMSAHDTLVGYDAYISTDDKLHLRRERDNPLACDFAVERVDADSFRVYKNCYNGAGTVSLAELPDACKPFIVEAAFKLGIDMEAIYEDPQQA